MHFGQRAPEDLNLTGILLETFTVQEGAVCFCGGVNENGPQEPIGSVAIQKCGLVGGSVPQVLPVSLSSCYLQM
jgi:hypothetical protein